MTDADGLSTCSLSTTEVGVRTLEIVEPVQLSGDSVEFVDCARDDGVLAADHPAAQTFGGGDGSVERPYRVCSPDHLGAVDDHGGEDFRLKSDLDMSGETDDSLVEWFSGSLDGNGHVVEQLTVDGGSAGLFEAVGESGVVEDIELRDVEVTGGGGVGGLAGSNRGTVRDANVTGSASRIEGDGHHVGGLVGLNQGGEIIDSSAVATVEVEVGDDDKLGFGGLVGANRDGGTITGCHADGEVTADSSAVGGLVGSHTDEESTIENCSADVDVEAGVYMTSSWSVAGGLVGALEGATVTDSTASGDVVGDGEMIGGLVGHVLRDSATVVDVEATGDVRGGDRLGGLVGYVEEGVVGEATASGNVEGGDRVGGLIGDHRAELLESQARGGLVVGEEDVGGLVGLNDGNATIDDESEVGAGLTVQGTDSVGGLVGSHHSSEVLEGRTLDENIGIEGQSRVGGLVGSSEAEVRESEVTGEVHFKAGVREAADQVGGLVGANGGAITDSEATGPVVAGGADVGGLVGRIGEDGLIDSDSGIGAGMQIAGGERVGGLIGVNEATDPLTDLELGEDIEIEGEDTVGGLVGVNEGVFESVEVFGDVGFPEKLVDSADNVGGLAGANHGILEDAVARIDVIGRSYVAGLVARNTGTIVDSRTTGDDAEVRAGSVGPGVDEYSFAAGLVGYSEGEIESSYSQLDVYAAGHGAAGLLGDNEEGRVIDSYATGEVRAGTEGDEGNGAAGLVASSNGGEIIGSHATGDVQAEGDFVGGLVALVHYSGADSEHQMVDSYATGDVTAGSDDGESKAGGLVGVLRWGHISRSHATGDVEAAGDKVGGLVGEHDGYGTITDCYAIGDVESAGNEVGGFIGLYYDTSGGLDSLVADSYSTGAVTGGNLTGGFVGHDDGGDIEDSFWDVDTSGMDTSDGFGAEGLETDQFDNSEGHFDDWDFDEIWEIGEAPDADKDSVPEDAERPVFQE